VSLEDRWLARCVEPVVRVAGFDPVAVLWGLAVWAPTTNAPPVAAASTATEAAANVPRRFQDDPAVGPSILASTAVSRTGAGAIHTDKGAVTTTMSPGTAR
jgi:hypothetical protein